METIETLIQQIEQIKIHLYNKISELPQNEQLQIVSEKPKCYIIKFSDIIGSPLNVEYYDFKKQYELIIKNLKKVKIENFMQRFKDVINNGFIEVLETGECRGNTINIKTRYNLNPKVIEFLKTIIS